MNSASVPQAVAYTFGAFRLDLEHRQLLADARPVTLTAKVYDTLLLLVENRARVVEKDEILGAVWPDSFVSEDSLTQVVSLLRRALGDDSSQPAYIATVPRRGYRFVAEVVEVAGEVQAESPESQEPPDVSADTLPAVALPPPPAVPSARRLFGWPVLSLGAAVVAVAVIFVARTAMVAPRGAPTGSPIRFVQATPDGTTLASSAEVSPDGRYLTFVAQDTATGTPHLWLRTLNVPTPMLLSGTDGAYRPFWSPDSQSIGFFADGKLKRIGVAGTPPQTLAAVGYRPSGGSWSPGGVLIYADRLSRLYAVSENGGAVSDLSALDPSKKETGHHSPHFLPDGKHYLFFASSAEPAMQGTYVGVAGSQERIQILESDSHDAVYAEPGYLLYVRDNVLIAQRFDAEAIRFTGAPVPVPAVNASGEDGERRVGPLSVSSNGLLTFGGDVPPNSLAWFSREGRELATIASPSNLHNPVLSPDGQSLLANSTSGLWIVDLERGASTRVLEGGNTPTWSADGAGIVFMSRSGNTPDLLARSINGHDEESLLVRSNEMKIPGNWSSDGQHLVYVSSNPTTRLDLWVLSKGQSAPFPFLRSPSNELHPQISPDGKSVAYASDESGGWEVYVQSFPVPGRKRTVSIHGGAQPQWRRDGQELFYLAPDGTMMAVSVKPGENIEIEKPRALFQAPVARDIITLRNQFAVSADGTRFVVDVARQRDPLNVVVNWNALVNP